MGFLEVPEKDMKFRLGDIVRATGGRLIAGDENLSCSGVGIDTRKIAAGELFVAIRGAHFDGHDFLNDAASRGASAFVVKDGTTLPDGMAGVLVPDTERALGDLAAWWRAKFDIPRVAITGSNGKSTTKEMAAAIAAGLGDVIKTEGNFNNLIGLPLTVFNFSSGHKVAILEMGMNAPGEIARLTRIADPTVGLITNVTAAHLEKLGSVDAVARAKGELFDELSERGLAVINDEDRRVKEMGAKFKGRKITFGMQNSSDVCFRHMDMDNFDSMKLKFAVDGREHEVLLPVVGAHNVMNALAAIGVGISLGIDPGEAAERLAGFKPMSMRMERVQLANGVRVVNDSYNANPESMKAAFRTVGAAKRAGRFLAALGDMLELGGASAELHRQVGEAAARSGVAKLYAVGEFASDYAMGARDGGLDGRAVVVCDDGANELGGLIEKDLSAGDVLLVKGSRGMKMERVVEYLKNTIGMG